jgi:acetyl-CoA carboxylase carboxyltransferase component
VTEPKARKIDPLNQLRQRKYEAGHGDAEAFNRQHAKGKLTARERIARLVDRNSFEPRARTWRPSASPETVSLPGWERSTAAT